CSTSITRSSLAVWAGVRIGGAGLNCQARPAIAAYVGYEESSGREDLDLRAETTGRKKRRALVRGGRAAAFVAALAEAEGIEVVRDSTAGEEVDLFVIEASTPAEMREALGPARRPVLVIAPVRLFDGEARALIEAGAAKVID